MKASVIWLIVLLLSLSDLEFQFFMLKFYVKAFKDKYLLNVSVHSIDTVNSIYTDTRNKDKVRYTDNLRSSGDSDS